MISYFDYVGKWDNDVTDEIHDNIQVLLARVNDLLRAYESDGHPVRINPATGTCVSGKEFGGLRPPHCTQGAPNSAHKKGQAVDITDPDGKLDSWVTDAILEEFDLYREHPDDTNGWLHLSIRRPGSGRRTFKP